MKRHNLLKIVLVLLFLAACNPMKVRDPKSASNPTAGPAPIPGLRAPLWTFSTEGAVWSSPTAADGMVYFGSDDHSLYAVNIKTHKLKWKVVSGDRVRSRPAVANGLVYFTSDDGYLYAVETQTGAKKWQLDIASAAAPRKMPTSAGYDYQMASPVIADRMLYVGSADSNLYAVDARTGQEKWRFKTGNMIRSNPTIVDGIVYVSSYDGIVYAVDTQTGQEVRKFDIGGTIPSSPTVVGGKLYIGSRAMWLLAIEINTGQRLWSISYAPSWVESTAIIHDGTLYIGSSDTGSLFAINSQTGQQKWRYLAAGYTWSTPAFADGTVYIGKVMYSGALIAVDAGTGQELWRVPIASTQDSEFTGVVSSPMVVDGVVYFGGLDGKLYAVSTAR